MKKFAVVVAAIAGLIASSGVRAGAQGGQAYVDVLASFIKADQMRNVDDHAGGGRLGFGVAVSENWNLQANIARANLDGTPGQELAEIGMDFQRVFGRSEALSPYLFFGISQLDVDLQNGPSSDGTAFAFGGGVRADAFGSDRVAIALEYRYRRDDVFPNDLSDQILSFGLHIPFGRSTPPAPVDGDADNDGVPNSVDQCAGTPMGRVVNGVGCELDGDNDGVADGMDQCPNTVAGAVVDTRGCALDGDGDGVPNGVDQCTNTRAGAQVDARGCEGDGDNDGVLNGVDACPDTTAGALVDVRGCEITDEITLPSVQFETNSATLLAGAQASLDDAVVTLNRYPELIVEVAGHTDTDGAEAYNQALSQDRAQTVLNYLVEAGIDASRLSAQGYGESQPIASNATAIGKARNRRVVLRLLEQ